MKKLKLNVEALKVEEFATTGDGAEERGTVRANQSGVHTQCDACLSGPYPCERSYAMTDGVAVCQCADGTGLCTD